jgi:protein ImuB
MFACIHASAEAALLVECAQAFSPLVEQNAPDIAVLDVSGLDRIYGAAHEIAAAIGVRARVLGFLPNIALASNPDTAIFAARGFAGVSVVPHGDEAKFLESLPLHLLGLEEETAETFERWGIRTFRELAVLPTIGIAGRLGDEGVRLQMLTRGEYSRMLEAIEEPPRFEEEMEMEYPVELLEPLLFVLGRMVGDLCRRLAGRGLATNELRLGMALEDRTEHVRALRFPVPMCDPRTFLKLMQLDLSSHPPGAAVLRVWVAASHTRPRVAQEGLFVPAVPEPEKLELTLARVASLVGEENVGSSELLDTHRPDAFVIRRFEPGAETCAGAAGAVTARSVDVQATAPSRSRLGCHALNRDRKGAVVGTESGGRATLAFRRYRPPIEAQVHIESSRPVFLLAGGIRGRVTSAAGPWRTSGDWWTADPWNREEWEVELQHGALYRIYFVHATGQWFVEGSFD